jgi:hypothetical protein
MYCDTLFTAKTMSGLVMVAYWSVPTTLLYRCGSSKASLDVRDRGEVDIRVRHGLVSVIFILERSLRYFVWHKSVVVGIVETLMPRK